MPCGPGASRLEPPRTPTTCGSAPGGSDRRRPDQDQTSVAADSTPTTSRSGRTFCQWLLRLRNAKAPLQVQLSALPLLSQLHHAAPGPKLAIGGSRALHQLVSTSAVTAPLRARRPPLCRSAQAWEGAAVSHRDRAEIKLVLTVPLGSWHGQD